MVKFSNEIRAIVEKLRTWFPGSLCFRIADPFDEILTTVAIQASIEDTFDFPASSAGVVDGVGRRAGSDARWKRVGEVAPEFRDVENRMSTYRGRENEPISDGRYDAIDAIRARVARKELVRRASLVRVVNDTICGDVNHITDDEFVMATTAICMEGLPVLRDDEIVTNQSEDGLQGVSELVSGARVVESLGIEQASRRWWVIAEISKEGRDTS